MKKSLITMFLISVLVIATHAISFNRIIYPLKTKDATGYVLVQEKQPLRIISVSPAITEILFEFQLSDRMVGITDKSNYPDGIKDLPEVGGDRLDNVKAIKQKPDLILVNKSENNADIEVLRKMKFTEVISTETIERTVEVFAVDPKSLSDILGMVSIIGTVTNREHSAYSLNQRLKRKIGWVEARAASSKGYHKYRALILTSKSPVVAAGNGTYLSDCLRVCGLINVAPKGSEYTKLSRKDIEKLNPDIIITSTDIANDPSDVYNSRDFRKTSAGVNKKAVCVDADLLKRPGPRVVQALEEIASKTYGWEKDANNKE